jgi:membrane-associated phospholipid phosphatase
MKQTAPEQEHMLRAHRWLAIAAFLATETLAHATYAGATCVALVLLFTTPGARRRWWSTLAIFGVAGMAWSRTYLQVHWLTDVIAGALLGSSVSLLVFAIAQRRAYGLQARGHP